MKRTNCGLILVFALVLMVPSCRAALDAAFKPTPTPALARTPRVEPDNPDTIKARIGEREVSLTAHEGRCRFSMEKTVVDLDLPAGCDFHRLPDKEVRVFPRDVYRDAKSIPSAYRNTTIILIEHSVRDTENARDCRTQIQAIKIEGDTVTKSTPMGNLASCPPFQWDAKNFTALFEKRKT